MATITYEELIELIEEKIFQNEANLISGDSAQEVFKAVAQFANSKELDPDSVIQIKDGEVPFKEPIIIYSGVSQLIKIVAVDGKLLLQKSVDDGENWEDVSEIDTTNSTIKNFPFPLNRFYTAIELVDVPLNIPVNAGETEDVTNATDDAFSEIVGCNIFGFADDKITVQNIPAGFKAWVKLTCTLNFIISTMADQVEFIINGKSFFYKPDDAVNIYQSSFSYCFLAENTEEFDIKVKNPSLGNYELDFISIFLDLELIKLEPII